MKNKLTDLNDHLFAQLERLGDESLDEDQLQSEINRAKAIQGIGQTVITNARLALDAEVARHEHLGGKGTPMPKMLESN